MRQATAGRATFLSASAGAFQLRLGLVMQFDDTDAGKRFIAAWQQALMIVDTGGGHSSTPPPTPAPAATPAK